ncbi:MAG: rhodanese [Nitrospinae bacterium]|nr:rhodanese [Nitrospinota bacterium]
MTTHVLPIQPIKLKERLDQGEDICVIDVREGWEHSLASIEGSEHIPLNELADRIQEIMFEEEIVVYCHQGERSYRGAQILIESGFKKVYNLLGGIDAWSQVVDPNIPRYKPGG